MNAIDLDAWVTELAAIGGEQSQEMFVEAISSGQLTHAELFDVEYRRIGFEEFKATYAADHRDGKVTDEHIRLLMDRVVEKDVDEYYRYHTDYDENSFLNRRALQIEEPFLDIANIDYAVLIDRNGYIPFHHTANAQQLTGDLAVDTYGNRGKRIWLNTLGKTQIEGEIAYYYYRRDTGILYLNVNIPIVIDGQYWGAFLVGYNAFEIDVAAANKRQNAIVLIVSIVLLTVTLYSVLIAFSLRPLSSLLSGVQRIQSGHLDVSIPVRSKDEIGYLSGAFNSMVSSIQQAEEQLEASNADLRVSNEKLAEYNRTLTEKVEERTQDLNQKNRSLEDTLQQVHDMQHQMIMQEKMASLGNLAAGVAHEVNTPIGAVYSAADTSARCIEAIEHAVKSSSSIDELKSNSRLVKSLEILGDNTRLTTTASQRITEIVRSLKTFSRLDEADYQAADLHEGLDSTLTLLAHESREHITVIKNYGKIPKLKCYPNQLNQVFMNLLMNGIQAIDGDGTISISTRANSSSIIVTITDSGCGIPPDRLSKIFDPGFTTKGVGVGTGLGLAICHQIVKKHNGHISVESEEGKGTSFSIELPVKSTQA